MARQLTLDLPFRPAMGRDDYFVSAANAGAVAQVDAWKEWPTAKLIICGPPASGKTHLAHVWAAASGARIVAAIDIAEQLESLMEAAALVVEDAEDVCDERPPRGGDKGKWTPRRGDTEQRTPRRGDSEQRTPRGGDSEQRTPRGGDREEGMFHLHNALAHRGAPLLITARTPPSRWGIKLPDLASRMAQAGLVKLQAPDDALLLAVMMKRAFDRKLPITPNILTYAAPRLERSFKAADAFIARVDALALSDQRKPTMAHAKAALLQAIDDPSS